MRSDIMGIYTLFGWLFGWGDDERVVLGGGG